MLIPLPTIPAKYSHFRLLTGIVIVLFGSYVANQPFQALNSLADKQSDLSKYANLDVAAFRHDSINLILKEAEISKANILLAHKSPDSIRLLIENNRNLADREIALHDFFQKHRPQEKALEVQYFINKKLDNLGKHPGAYILGGGFLIGLGFIECYVGWKMITKDHKKEADDLHQSDILD